jgi:hypothetical protein
LGFGAKLPTLLIPKSPEQIVDEALSCSAIVVGQELILIVDASPKATTETLA